MMGDMKEIQEDTKVALVEQTEKITKIDDNVTQVEEDVTLAHAEIVSA
jgi:t-SNARE complex subunit (syntaxin)